MQRSNAVYRMSIVNIHVSHVNTIVSVDNVYRLIVTALADPVVQLPDNGKQMRNYLLHVIHGPLLKSLCKDGVIRISAGLCNHINGFVHCKTMKSKLSDKLRNNHGRMCIIDLDSYMFVQIVKIISGIQSFLNNKLGAAANHEILLIYS